MPQGNILDRIESRILISVTAFVGIMVLVGWVAINENARMSSFERQYQARSIERGAALFSVNCSSCHGADGRGIGGSAPGLSNPQFFGYDFVGPIDADLEDLQKEGVRLTEERAQINQLVAELDVDSETYAEDLAGYQARLDEINEAINGENGISVRYGNLLPQRESVIAGLQIAAQNGYPIFTDVDENGDEFLNIQSARLDQVKWAGTMYDFIFTTLVHGRPTSISYWGGKQMVAWSQRAGGPLRDDQLADLTEYILNWDKGDDWTLEDAWAVNQYAIEPSLPGATAGGSNLPPAGSDVAAIMARIEEQGIVGDPANGEQLYTAGVPTGRGKFLGCAGCHTAGQIAPLTEGTWGRTVNERLVLPEFSGYTPEQYLIESIVRPGDYIVEGFQSGVMLGTFGSDMALQDIADVIAYLRALDG